MTPAAKALQVVQAKDNLKRTEEKHKSRIKAQETEVKRRNDICVNYQKELGSLQARFRRLNAPEDGELMDEISAKIAVLDYKLELAETDLSEAGKKFDEVNDEAEKEIDEMKEKVKQAEES